MLLNIYALLSRYKPYKVDVVYCILKIRNIEVLGECIVYTQAVLSVAKLIHWHVCKRKKTLLYLDCLRQVLCKHQNSRATHKQVSYTYSISKVF